VTIERAYQQARTRQRLDLEQRVQRSVREMNESVQSSTWTLNFLRGARLTLDVFAVVLAIVFAYRTEFWFLGIAFIPLGIGLSEDLVRLLCTKYLQRQRANLVSQQKENIRELIQVAYIDSRLQMPRSMGRQLYSLANLEDRLLRQLAAAMGEG